MNLYLGLELIDRSHLFLKMLATFNYVKNTKDMEKLVTFIQKLISKLQNFNLG